MAAEREILRSAGVVGLHTLLSRVLGYVRDRLVAYLLGTSLWADAFYALYRLPNTFRRLVGEGALTAAVVPVFTRTHVEEGEEAAWTLGTRLFWILSFILAAVTLAVVIFSAPLLQITGFAQNHAGVVFSDAVALNRILFPYLFFICLAALAMALLNSAGSFGPSAFTPVLLNLSIIASALAWGRHSANPAMVLAWGVLAGGALQLGFQIPFLVKHGMRFRFIRPLVDKKVLQVAWLFVPAAFGAGITQVNILVGTLVATYLDPGSVSSLYYADRIMELTYGAYALGIATVMLPALSRLSAQGDVAGVKRTLAFALRMAAFVMLPSSLGLIALRVPIVEVLFLGGRYDGRSAAMTAFPLLFYSIGLTAYAAVKIAVNAFYAEKDTRTPVKAAFAAFAANILLMSLLAGPLTHGGIALASAAAAYLNAGLLLAVFVWRHGALAWDELLVSLAKTTLASLVMYLAVLWLAGALGLSGPLPLAAKTWRLAACITAGAGVFFLTAAVLRSRELTAMREMRRRTPSVA